MVFSHTHPLSMDNSLNAQEYVSPFKRTLSESDISSCPDSHSSHDSHKNFDGLFPGFSKFSQVNAGISPLLTALDLAEHSPPDSRKVTKAPAVKTMGSKASSFDFQFVHSTDEVRKILTLLTGNDKSGDVIVLTHPDDLNRDHLVHQLQITKEGPPILTPGKLFESKAQLTLVLDIRTLTAEELPRFNDLLDPDNPCLYDKVTGMKRPLGQHVNLLVLADPEQLAAVGSDDKAPGADFWRRINRPGNTWQGQKLTSAINAAKSDSAQLLSEFLGNANNHPKAITIDCHLHHDWRQLLFGGPGVDDNGKIQHLPGRLAKLEPHQPVILKGVNWHDLAFEQSMRLLKARKQYVSNGETITLQKGVEFYRAGVAEQELAQLFQRFAMAPDNIPDMPVVINQSNLSEWLNGIKINKQGYAQKHTPLQDQIEAGGTLTLTSPLSEDAWFQLLGRLDGIREHTGLKTSIFIAHPKDQPKSLQLDKGLQLDQGLPSTDQRCNKLCRNKGLKAITYQQETQAYQWLENHLSKPLMIQVNAQTTLAQLFDNLHVISEKRAQFGRQPTDLHKALKEGNPVVLQGLETNPRLQQLLEPLCCGQPLLVNGVLQPFPNANITLLWPTSTQSSSPLWRQLLASADQCPEPDIWESAALRFSIGRDALPEKAINGIYQAFNTVPRDLSPVPGPLPALTAGLLANLIQAAGQARQLDKAERLEPVHWRKAINSVLTHGTRQNPAVRDFMKFACEQLLPDADPSPWVDPDRLATVLDDCQKLDRDTLEKQVWPLARAFHPGVFRHDRIVNNLDLSFNLPYSKFRRDQTLDALCALVAAHAPEALRDAVACQLEVTPQKMAAYQHLPARPGVQIKRLEDALYSGWRIRSEGKQTRSALINHLAITCFDIARDASADEASRKHRIKTVLAQHLIWTGRKTAPLDALVDDLYRCHIGQQDREQRRLHRLKSRLAESPVIFLQGETGTGKSYFSAKMARAAGSSFIVSIGPSTSEQSLMQSWVWQEGEDNDRLMKQQKQILLQWAETVPSSDDDYVTLVIDEANLASPQLLTTLKGLWQQQPCVYIGGHPVKVSAKHRIILTGNPDYYAGRQLDPVLKDKMQRVYYPPLDRPFLQDCVIEPALRQHLLPHMTDQQARELAQQASSSVLALWQFYPELLPDHQFTPRDLTDICAWVGWYLNQPPVPSLEHPKTSAITREQIHALVLQGFRDVLNPELAENQKEALAALEIWFAARFSTDNALVEQAGHTLKLIGNNFRFETGIHKSEFDTSAPAVSELVQQLGQDLSRCQQAWHFGVKHGGRQATLIEGPAGRGKDVTLQLLIDSFSQQIKDRCQSMPPVRSLNACDCSWETLCSAIAQSRANGGILVISELNLIDSQHLEGELNDILAGDAHPGFHLFATTNPPQYSGRKPLSPALKGRFRHLPIRKYNRDELTAIAQKTLPDTPNGNAVAIQLTHWHCQLRRDLHQKNQRLQPTCLDLQGLAGEVARSGDFSKQSLQHHTSRHYRLYLMAAQCSLRQLPDRTTEITMAIAPIDRELCQWFSGTLSVNRPWLIRRGIISSISVNRHQMTVPVHLETAAARREVIKMVAEARWWESGLAPDPDPADDALIQALYRRWQHQWFNQHFADTDVQADEVFPMSEAQALAMAMEANQPYLIKVDRLISEQILNTVNLWPTIWASLRDRVYHSGRHDQQQEPADLQVTSMQEDQVTPMQEDQVTPMQEDQVTPMQEDQVTPMQEDQVAPMQEDQVASMQEDCVNAISTNLAKSRESTRHFIRNQPGCGDLLLPSLPQAGIGLPGRGIDKNISKKSSTLRLDLSPPRQLGKSTAYPSNKELPTVTATKHFNSHHEPELYRLSVNNINVKTDGNIELIRFQGISGFKTVNPTATWPEQGPILLARDQIMASVTLQQATASDWLSLPSLKPDETIIALRSEPVASCQIIKDRYTGLHMVNFPELPNNKNIKIDYVVESKASGTTPNRQYTMAFGDTGTSKRSDATCSTTIKAALDKLFDTKNQADLPEDHQQQLRSINNPDNCLEERIAAISAYCREFTGQSNPKPDENFFEFLIRSRQGACRHRAPVFVAMCRYFGIPARVVENDIHAFPEYSLDNGRSWQSQHLGGAPTNVKSSKTKFPPSMERLSQRQYALLKNASPAQKEACAKALGQKIGEFNHAIKNSLPLVASDDSYELSTNADIVKKMWETPNQACFAMGAELLIASEKLSDEEKHLAGDFYNQHTPLGSAVEDLIRFGEDNKQLITELITEKLNKLHSRIFRHGDFNHPDWLYTIVTSLKRLFRRKDEVVSPQVKQLLASHAFESGWLNPEPDKHYLAMEHHSLLLRMKGVEALAPLASTCLQKWYDHWLGRDKYTDIIRHRDIAYSGISHDHGGKSAFLESIIITRGLASSWTDEPEGVPNIERLLTRNPAFPIWGSGKTAHRPMILMGSLAWFNASAKEILDKLYQCYVNNHPDAKRLVDKKVKYKFWCRQQDGYCNLDTVAKAFLGMISSRSDHCNDFLQKTICEWIRDYDDILPHPHPHPHSNAYHQLEDRMKKICLHLKEHYSLTLQEKNRLETIEKRSNLSISLAFSHYVYGMAHSNGGRLLVCWINACAENCSDLPPGYHEPASPEELAKLLSIYHFERDIDHYHLLKTHNANNGVILNNSDMAKIAKEFIDSVDVNSLYDEVCQHIEAEGC